MKLKAMRDMLIEGLTEIPHSILNGDRDLQEGKREYVIK